MPRLGVLRLFRVSGTPRDPIYSNSDTTITSPRDQSPAQGAVDDSLLVLVYSWLGPTTTVRPSDKFFHFFASNFLFRIGSFFEFQKKCFLFARTRQDKFFHINFSEWQWHHAWHLDILFRSSTEIPHPQARRTAQNEPYIACGWHLFRVASTLGRYSSSFSPGIWFIAINISRGRGT